MGNSMSNVITPSYSNDGTNFQGNSGSAQSLYQFGVAAQSTSLSDGHMASHLSVQPIEEAPLGADRTVAELAIRQLTREIGHAKEELHDLEETLVYELVTPPAAMVVSVDGDWVGAFPLWQLFGGEHCRTGSNRSDVALVTQRILVYLYPGQALRDGKGCQ